MQHKILAALAATAALGLGISQAQATVFTGTWTLDELKTSDPGLALVASSTSGAFDVDLGANDPNTAANEEIAVLPLFSLYTTESSIDFDDIFFTGTAKISFNFASPSQNDGPTSVTGITGGLIIPFLFRGGYLDWNPGDLGNLNGKTQLNYGPLNDGKLSIYVNGGTYNRSNRQLPVAATFDWDADATVVPEPATWALMIGGFGMAGAALRRRRLVPARA